MQVGLLLVRATHFMAAQRVWLALPVWARPIYAVCHPAMLLPLALVAIRVCGSYSPAEITQARLPLFLQGGTDWGGSNIFAVTVTLYAIFGVLGSVYLVLRRSVESRVTSYPGECRAGLWTLRLHIALFFVVGILTWGEDSRIRPNDFRNMFLLASTLYTVSIAYVAWLIRRRWDLRVKVLAAPLALWAWLIVGSDGNTAKAGQMRYSGENPEWRARGTRHGMMLKWHQACDTILGNI